MDSRSSETTLLAGEILGSLDHLDLAFDLAWTDTRTRYRRSVLGPFWLVIGTAIGVGGLGFVWGHLFDVDRSYFVPSLTIGLVTWYLISAALTEGAAVFYSSRSLLLNIPVSSILVSLILLLKQLVNFAHNMLVVVLVLMIYPQHISFTALAFLPGLALASACLLGAIHFVGYVGARYRDLAPLIAALMQPLFFLTPVLFRPDQLGARAFIVEFNPLTYLLAVVRDPLMGTLPALTTWLAVIAMTVVVWTAALLMTASKRRRLSYWIN